MTPKTLAAKIVEIISKECKCEIVWQQHEGPMTMNELSGIVMRTCQLLLTELDQAAERDRLAAEQSAKRRIHRRGMLATAVLLLILAGALVWWWLWP